MNIGWFYQKEYFKGIDFVAQTKKKDDFRNNDGAVRDWERLIKQNNTLIAERNSILLGSHTPDTTPFYSNKVSFFQAKSIYPGIATGIGMKHEAGVEGELKLGMYFDYTNGMPCIPAASVKGALRSAFPQYEKHRKTPKEIKQAKAYLIYCGLNAIDSQRFPDKGVDLAAYETDFGKISELEYEIFDGKNFDSNKKDKKGNKRDLLTVYEKDIFHDAFITKGDTKKRIIGNDAITHHPSPLKNPNPVLFLKIMPGVNLQFNFDLKDGSILTKEQKLSLFKYILFINGIGAKTNVGYGQLEGA